MYFACSYSLCFLVWLENISSLEIISTSAGLVGIKPLSTLVDGHRFFFWCCLGFFQKPRSKFIWCKNATSAHKIHISFLCSCIYVTDISVLFTLQVGQITRRRTYIISCFFQYKNCWQSAYPVLASWDLVFIKHWISKEEFARKLQRTTRYRHVVRIQLILTTSHDEMSETLKQSLAERCCCPCSTESHQRQGPKLVRPWDRLCGPRD